MASTIYRFSGFELDLALYELRREGHVVAVGPRGFDVLCHLVAHRDRVVQKEELLSAVWSVSVGESVLPRCMTVLRRALGDDGVIIETVRGRGYRFAAAVEVEEGAPPGRRSTMPPPPSGPGLPGLSIVGRGSALEELGVAIDEATVGRGSVVVLYGEAGIGKTAMIRELERMVVSRGFLAVLGRGYERAEAVPFWPWTEALRSLVARMPRDDLEASISPHAAPLLELLPELEELLPGGDPPPQTLDRARFRLFEAVLHFIERASRRTPLLIVLEDAHSMDAASLRLLEFVVRGVGHAPVLVAVTHRDVDLPASHALAHALAALAREPDCRRIELPGLTAAEVREFIDLAGLPRSSPQLADRVHAVSGGNPLFVSELVRLARSGGELSVIEGSPLPRPVLDAVRQQLQSLAPATVAMLEAASVIGHDVQAGPLARTAGVSRAESLAALDEAVAARILRRQTKGHSFRHAIVRDAIYERLSDARRATLHGGYADVLEEIGGVGDAQLAALAHHYFHAVPTGSAHKALLYLRRAAEAALRAHAPEDAADQLERCLSLAESEPLLGNEDRVDLLIELGEAQAHARRRARARESFEGAARAARQLEDPVRFARAAVGFAGETELFQPRDEARLRMLEEARAGLGVSAAPDLRSILTSELSATAPHWEDLQARRSLSAEALSLALRSGNDRAISRALWARCHALLGPDDSEECLSRANELLDLAVRMGSPLAELRAMDVMLTFQIARGDVGHARRTLEQIERVVRENDFGFWRWWVRSSRAGMAIVEGRFDDARALINENLVLGRRVEHPLVLPVAAGQWMQLGILSGDLESLGGSLDVFESFSWGPRLLPVARAVLAEAMGEVEEERTIVASFPEDLREVPRDEFWLLTLSMMGTCVANLGDRARSRTAYDLLLPYAEWNAVHLLTRLHLGAVSGTLARLAACLGLDAQARRHYESALRMDRRMGAWAFRCVTQWSYAGLLLRSTDAGDVTRGRAMAGETRELAERLGMKSLVSRLSRMLA